VATGGLSPGDIVSPLRAVFHRYKNINVIMAEVVGIDANNRKIILKDKDGEVEYDTLVIATRSCRLLKARNGKQTHKRGRNR
jgi:NADH dehydrogenase